MNVDVEKKLYNILSNAGLGVEVVPESPDRNYTLPCVTYREVSQEEEAKTFCVTGANDRMALSTVDVNVYVDDASRPNTLALAVYTVMDANGFDMDASINITDTESRLKGREMRFSRLANTLWAAI